MVFLLKAIIFLTGMGFIIPYTIAGLTQDKKDLKKTALIFGLTWVLLLIITVTEFWIYQMK